MFQVFDSFRCHWFSVKTTAIPSIYGFLLFGATSGDRSQRVKMLYSSQAGGARFGIPRNATRSPLILRTVVGPVQEGTFSGRKLEAGVCLSGRNHKKTSGGRPPVLLWLSFSADLGRSECCLMCPRRYDSNAGKRQPVPDCCQVYGRGCQPWPSAFNGLAFLLLRGKSLFLFQGTPG